MTDTKAASHITDHPYTPGTGPWWSRCQHVPDDSAEAVPCGMAEAAHQRTVLVKEDTRHFKRSTTRPGHAETIRGLRYTDGHGKVLPG
jgi:hypothetical protein